MMLKRIYRSIGFTVELLYKKDTSKCPYKRGVLISGVVLYINVETPESVLIRECPY